MPVDRRAVVGGLVGMAAAGASYRWWPKRSTSAGGGGGEPALAQAPLRVKEGPRACMIAQVPIGGGGFVTGIDISHDGRRTVCRTDVANAYVRDHGDRRWRPLFSPTTMSPKDYDPLPALGKFADGQGVAGIRIAPSNSDVIYASYYGFIWCSEDGGKSIRRTAGKAAPMPSNAGGQRLFNRLIDVHPRDPRRVVVGTWGEGIRFSADAGQNWQTPDIPKADVSFDNQPGIALVAYDPAADDRVYTFVTGQGLFRSDHGGAGPFVPVSGGPSYCSNLVTDKSGTVYLCETTKAGVGGAIWRYRPDGTWTRGMPHYEAAALAVSPSQPDHLVCVNPNGFFMESRDAARTWNDLGSADRNATNGEVAWIGDLKTLFPSEFLFSPNQPDVLMIAHGVGVSELSLADGMTRRDLSAGIEEMCAVSALCVPGGSTYFSAWDKSFWRLDDMTRYANRFHYPVATGKTFSPDKVAYASYMDFAGSDGKFVVGIYASSDDSGPGYTNDGGASWQRFDGTPAAGWGQGGCIAASTQQNFVVLPSNNAAGAYTLDGGKSWSPVMLDGQTPTINFANSYFVARKNIAADKTRTGVFALVYTVIAGESENNPLGGLWMSRDGGKSWNQQLKGVISSGSHDPKAVRAAGLEQRQFWQCQLEYVPGMPSRLVYTPHADYTGDRFYWSEDDGVSWKELHPRIRNVKSFGFGKAAPGEASPAIYFWGEVNGVQGLYVSTDWCRTLPQLLTRFPSPILAGVSHVTGDLDHFGHAYVGTGCGGWVRVTMDV